ncbi:MAG: hypothetical protein JO096_00730 [Alphaproteobacteria bacterium]|nr:hypothetical protein [Alphaproteobacteria bacterium]
MAQDKPALSQADGVGPRLAARIINELRDKLGSIVSSAAPSPAVSPNEPVNGARAAADAVSALENLGIGRTEALGAIAAAAHRFGNEAAADVLIKAGLEELAR